MLIFGGIFFVLCGIAGLAVSRRYDETESSWNQSRLRTRLRLPSASYYKRVNLIVSVSFIVVGVLMLIIAAT